MADHVVTRTTTWTALAGAAILTAPTMSPDGRTLYVTTGKAEGSANLHAFDLEGRQLAVASTPNRVVLGANGAAEQDLDGTWADTAATLGALADPTREAIVQALEPSAGIGRFLHALSLSGFENVNWTAVEYSALSSAMLRAK